MFDLLFTTKIREELRFSSFTAQHTIILLTVFSGIALAAISARKMEIGARENILITLTWAIPCVYASRFIVFLLLDLFVEPQMSLLDRLPFHLCSLNAIVMPVAILAKNKTLLNYMYAVSLPGAAAAMLTPAMSYYGRYFYLSWQVISFYLDHGFMVLVPILAIACGRLRPDYKYLPRVIMLFLPYASAVYIANKLLGENWLFLNNPDEGTVIAFFAAHFGNPGYIAALGALTAAIMLLMLLPWIVIDKRTSKIARAKEFE